MLTNKERRETVDYIVSKVAEKGKLVLDSGAYRRYELGLVYCSLFILKTHQETLEPVVEIAENFGNPEFRPETWQDKSFDGLRTLYRGGRGGLDEVALQGINVPDAYGKVLSAAESLRRSKELNYGRNLTNQDLERFDAFLKYAQNELQE
jgi:hypothetical protein